MQRPEIRSIVALTPISVLLGSLVSCASSSEPEQPDSDVGIQDAAVELSGDESSATPWGPLMSARVTAQDVVGEYAAEGLELRLDAGGTYSWTSLPDIPADSARPPFPASGQWTLHGARVGVDGVESSAVLRLGPDGTAGTLVPTLRTVNGELALEVVPGKLTLLSTAD